MWYVALAVKAQVPEVQHHLDMLRGEIHLKISTTLVSADIAVIGNMPPLTFSLQAAPSVSAPVPRAVIYVSRDQDQDTRRSISVRAQWNSSIQKSTLICAYLAGKLFKTSSVYLSKSWNAKRKKEILKSFQNYPTESMLFIHLQSCVSFLLLDRREVKTILGLGKCWNDP